MSEHWTIEQCHVCEGRGYREPHWPVGPGGARLATSDCYHCGGTGNEPTSRPVMNPPADEAEAGNRVHAAPPQADSDAGRRGVAGPLTEPEARPVMPTEQPIPMLLWCPSCGDRHIDVGEFATKVHHTHACQSCGMVWRPAIVSTVGVQWLPGFKND